jgi:hypothetical protein
MNRRNRLRRAGLVLALLLLPATVTGVAASATKTVIPKQLTGRWERDNGRVIVVAGGKVVVKVDAFTNGAQARFSHVKAHRLSISGLWSCSGAGTYRWTITQGVLPGSLSHGYVLRLTKIHDACKARVRLFAHSWGRP